MLAATRRALGCRVLALQPARAAGTSEFSVDRAGLREYREPERGADAEKSERTPLNDQLEASVRHSACCGQSPSRGARLTAWPAAAVAAQILARGPFSVAEFMQKVRRQACGDLLAAARH